MFLLQILVIQVTKTTMKGAHRLAPLAMCRHLLLRRHLSLLKIRRLNQLKQAFSR